MPKAVAENGIVLKKFYPEDVEAILSTFALTGGNAPKASRILEADMNISVHPVTIKKMAHEQFPVKYAEIQQNIGSQINTVVTGRLGEVVLRGTDLQSSLLDRIDKRLGEETDTPLKDLAPAFRNVAQATKDNIIQKQLLENKPTSITETRTIEEAIKELEDDEIVIDAKEIIEEDLPDAPENKEDSNPDTKNGETLKKIDDVLSSHSNETIEDFPF